MVCLTCVLACFMWTIALLGWGYVVWIFLTPGAAKQEVCLKPEIRIPVWGALGFTTIAFLATVTNFVAGVDTTVSIFVALAGVLLFIAHRRPLVSWIKFEDGLLILAVFVYTSLIPIFSAPVYDTGLYHWQTIKWINAGPLPLGLANLHGRFGFNSSWFAAGAVIEVLALLHHTPKFIINALVMFFWGSAVLLATKRCLEGVKCLSGLFAATTGIAWLARLPNFVHSPSPDLPLAVMTFLVVYLVLVAFEDPPASDPALVLATVLSAFGVTVKLSAAPLFAGSLMLLALRSWLLVKSRIEDSNASAWLVKPTREAWRSWTRLMVCLGLVLGPWMLKGVWLSGCLAYPTSLGHFSSLKWAVTPEQLANETASIRGWARHPGAGYLQSLVGWDWVLPWWHRIWESERLLVYLMLVGVGTVGIAILRNRFRGIDWRPFLVGLTLSLLGTVFWFLTAPDPRFAYGFLFGVPLLFCCQGCRAIRVRDFFQPLSGRYRERAKEAATGLACAALVLIILGYRGLTWSIGLVTAGILVPWQRWRVSVLVWIMTAALLLNGAVFRRALRTSWSETGSFDRVDLTTVHQDGFSAVVPNGTDQCWDAPLPCTPALSPKLKRAVFGNGRFLMFWVHSP